MTHNLLSELNEAQRRAAEHYSGPMVVVAGAGTGKTRTLTYRIGHLIHHHGVKPEQILALTFTNKAAGEMKERLAVAGILDKASLQKRNALEGLSIGTFHGICASLLRLGIESYVHPRGYRWTRNFRIYDELAVKRIIERITTKELKTYIKIYKTDKTDFPDSFYDKIPFLGSYFRKEISKAKNKRVNADQYETFKFKELEAERRSLPKYVISTLEDEDERQSLTKYLISTTAEVYRRYEAALAKENALDFDDLILKTVELFEQCSDCLNLWHQRYRHILVDEFQDTNLTQYDLLKLLTTNKRSPVPRWNDKSFWKDRSIFVVGDVDQSIYSFRCTDFTILLDFQTYFGDGKFDEQSKTLIKLEVNYRSTANILDAANCLIEYNKKRIPKILRPTKGEGAPIQCVSCPTDTDEANFVVQKIKELTRSSPKPEWERFAILYRTNAQSRLFEAALFRNNIPYTIVRGLNFYQRKEIKDILAYLRLLKNPDDDISLMQIINVPHRGIDITTLERLIKTAKQKNVSLWKLISEDDSIKFMNSGVQEFVECITSLRLLVNNTSQCSLTDLVRKVIEETGYRRELEKEFTHENAERLQNLDELISAVSEFSKEDEGTSLSESLSNFLNNSDLYSNSDSLQNKNKGGGVSLMTLHASKGLEFPVVFLVGMEEGLLPSFLSLNTLNKKRRLSNLEEERRLCYVGITRAQEQLFLTFAQCRRISGNYVDTIASRFLSDIADKIQIENINLTDPGDQSSRELMVSVN